QLRRGDAAGGGSRAGDRSRVSRRKSRHARGGRRAPTRVGRSLNCAGATLLAALALAACCPPAVAPEALEVREELGPVAWRSNGGHSFALRGQAPGGPADEAAGEGEAAGSGTPRSAATDVDLAARFESAWRLVAERYWDLASLAVDWDEVGESYRAKLADLSGPSELYALLEEMY